MLKQLGIDILTDIRCANALRARSVAHLKSSSALCESFAGLDVHFSMAFLPADTQWFCNVAVSIQMTSQFSNDDDDDSSREFNEHGAKFAEELFSAQLEAATEGSTRLFWNSKLAMLSDFKAKHGHCRASKHNKTHVSIWGKELGVWVDTQRTGRKNNWLSLTPERVAKLDALGFEWAPGGGRPSGPSTMGSYGKLLRRMPQPTTEDGLIKEFMLAELRCLMTANHLAYHKKKEDGRRLKKTLAEMATDLMTLINSEKMLTVAVVEEVPLCPAPLPLLCRNDL